MLGQILIPFLPKASIRRFMYEKFGVFVYRTHWYSKALTHSSKEKKAAVSTFERLEFLGDGVIELIIRDYLMQRFDDKTEGELTKLKSFLLSRKTLGKIAREIGVDQMLKTDGRNLSERTSVYGNALESLFGAIYLDRGYKRTQKVVVQFFDRHIDLNMASEKAHNYKGEVIEWAQRMGKKWKLESQELPQKKFLATLFIDGDVQTVGVSGSKKDADQKACRIFWDYNRTEQG